MTKDEKSGGGASPQKVLPRLFENTFLRFSGRAAPRRADGEPLCDLLAALGGRVLVFCETDGEAFRAAGKETRAAAWKRWRNEILAPELARLREAEAYVKSGADVLAGRRGEKSFSPGAAAGVSVHKIAVVPDLRRFSERFPRGRARRIASRYGYPVGNSPAGQFRAGLPKKEMPHVIDAPALEILLRELDTFTDFADYLAEKETAAREMESIEYRGEENLLADYLLGYEEEFGKCLISPPEVRAANERLAEASLEGLSPPERPETSSGESLRGWYLVLEGNEWEEFFGSEPYARGKRLDGESRMWDEFILAARRNFEEGTVIPAVCPERVSDPVEAMAEEPRASRIGLVRAIRETAAGIARDREAATAVFFPGGRERGKCCVVLWLECPDRVDPSTDYRLIRREALEHCCAAAREQYPGLEKAVGAALEMPGREKGVPDDFILFDFSGWDGDDRKPFDLEKFGPEAFVVRREARG